MARPKRVAKPTPNATHATHATHAPHAAPSKAAHTPNGQQPLALVKAPAPAGNKLHLQYPYAIRWLPVGRIEPHPKIQRHFVPSNAKRLLANWDTDQMGELEVVPGLLQDGTPGYLCFEGQHRLWAVYRWLGEDAKQEVPCRVYGEVPIHVLAQFRLSRDSQLRQVPVDRFRMKLYAQDKTALLLEAILARFELRIGAERVDGCIGSVVACERAVAQPGGPAAFERAISLLYAAFGKSREAYDGVLVSAVNMLVRQYGAELRDHRLVAALQSPPRRTPNVPVAVSLVASARAIAREVGNISSLTAMADLLVRAYNRARVKNGGSRLAQWRG